MQEKAMNSRRNKKLQMGCQCVNNNIGRARRPEREKKGVEHGGWDQCCYTLCHMMSHCDPEICTHSLNSSYDVSA